jgi:chaperonin cofactor prefoldin
MFGDMTEIKGVEILNSYYNTKGFEANPKVFDELIENFSETKNLREPGVKISHSEQQTILKSLLGREVELGEELPSLGVIDRLYHDGKSLFADIKNVPSKLKNVFGEMYRFISPEISKNFRGTGKKLLTAIALTNNPSQKHIAHVHLTDEGCAFSGIILSEEDAMSEINENAVESIVEKVSAKISGLFKKDEPVALSDNTEIIAEMKKEIETLKAKIGEKESDQESLSEKLLKMAEETRAKTAEAIGREAIAEGVPPVVVNALKPLLMSEAVESTVKLSEGETTVSQLIQDVFKNYPNKVKLSDSSHTSIQEPGDDVKLSEIEKKKTEYMQSGMTEYDALVKAGIEIKGGA